MAYHRINVCLTSKEFKALKKMAIDQSVMTGTLARLLLSRCIQKTSIEMENIIDHAKKRFTKTSGESGVRHDNGRNRKV
jgi:hypothetical protein